jgi:Sec-independent protein translocase protein TatA
MRPDKWPHQRAAQWIRAEAIQRAFRKGATDESDEHRQREIEKQRKQDAGKPTAAEQASIERLKGRAG